MAPSAAPETSTGNKGESKASPVTSFKPTPATNGSANMSGTPSTSGPVSNTANNSTSCGGTDGTNAVLISRFLAAGAGKPIMRSEALLAACLLSPTVSAAISGDTKALATLRNMHAKWQAAVKPASMRAALLATCDTRTQNFTTDANSTSRFNSWMLNLRTVLAVNADPNATYWAGLNAYSDMSAAEFSSVVLMGGLTPSKLLPTPAAATGSRRLLATFKPPAAAPAYPASVDWQAAGKAVVPAGSQGACASSWAFAAAGAVQSRLLIATNSTASKSAISQLSARQILECATAAAKYTIPTCAGGYVSDAFTYAQAAGLTSESAFPYQRGNDLCAKGEMAKRCVVDQLASRTRRGGLVKITASPTFARVAANNKTALLLAVSKQPVVVYLTADPAFQHYAGGVFTSTACAGQSVNHALLLVGYTTTGATPSWLAVNSLGTSWGQNGLVSLALAGDGAGLCGMYQYALYPGTAAIASQPSTRN